jgi:hypothetical protein
MFSRCVCVCVCECDFVGLRWSLLCLLVFKVCVCVCTSVPAGLDVLHAERCSAVNGHAAPRSPV